MAFLSSSKSKTAGQFFWWLLLVKCVTADQETDKTHRSCRHCNKLSVFVVLIIFYKTLWKRFLQPCYQIIFLRSKYPINNSKSHGAWAIIYNVEDNFGKEYARYLVQCGINVCYLKKWQEVDEATAKIKSELLCDQILQNTSSKSKGYVQILGYNEKHNDINTATKQRKNSEICNPKQYSLEEIDEKQVNIYNSWTHFNAMLRVKLGQMHLDGGIGYCIYTPNAFRQQDTCEAISIGDALPYLKFRSTGAMIRLILEKSLYNQKLKIDSIYQECEDNELHESYHIDFLTVIIPSELNGYTFQEMTEIHTIATFLVLGFYSTLSFRTSQLILICKKFLTKHPFLSESRINK